MENNEWLESWDRRIRKTIESEQLFRPEETVLVAVSGGVDSVALLHWLNRWRHFLDVRLVVGHVHHGLREKSADEDQAFVEQLAKSYELPVLTQKLSWTQRPQSNVQALARKRRYEALVMMAQRTGARKIALAHHATDQVETMLMKMLKGTSPDGLAGMPIRRGFRGIELVRPFLYETRQMILTYSTFFGLKYREDASNMSLRYRRNAIRHTLLPVLKTIEPTMERHISSLSRQLKDDAHFFHALAFRFLQKNAVVAPGIGELSRASLEALPASLQRRVIHLIWSYLQRSPDSKQSILSFSHLETIHAFVMEEESFSMSLPGSIQLWVKKDRVIFYRQPSPRLEVLLLPGSVVAWPESNMLLALLPLQKVPRTMIGAWSGETDERWPSFLFLSDTALASMGKLTVRTFQPGDRFWHKPDKKVKEAWDDLGIERPWRARWPLITAGGRIVWIPPFFLERPSNRITPKGETAPTFTSDVCVSESSYVLFALKTRSRWPWEHQHGLDVEREGAVDAKEDWTELEFDG